jgi:hypothetical protein
VSELDRLLGPGFARVARARKALEDACAAVADTARVVDDFGPMGTDELPAAIAALASSEYVDEDDAAARWVSRTFTATPIDLIPTGEAGLAFGGAVMMMRGALNELDEALAATDRPGSTKPDGTAS